MDNDDQTNDRDRQLFRETVGNVTRLRPTRYHARPPRPSPHPRTTEDEAPDPVPDGLSDGFDPGDIEPGEYLFFARPGVKKGVLRKLRRGQLRLDAELDLHGLVVPEARQMVTEFLGEALGRGARCVKIIHGKGYGSSEHGPVLKSMMVRWLPQRDDVLAYCSAIQQDGGTGAMYVLLKRL